MEAGLLYTQLANERQALFTEMEARKKRARVEAFVVSVPADQIDAVRALLDQKAAVVKGEVITKKATPL